MPGGQFDSSKTRVSPVFDELAKRSDNWVLQLLELTSFGVDKNLDLKFLKGYWGTKELGLHPPVSLLSWLIRHPKHLKQNALSSPERELLLNGNPEKVEEALTLLRTENRDRAWYIFEGRTYPDAVIETPDALIVIEGKRTEAGPTTSTKWLEGRHQIWRHIDAAWEQRGKRRVFGLFIVESDGECGDVPQHWKQAIKNSLVPSTLATSFPHRSNTECEEIRQCLLGVTTWQAVCREFSLPAGTLLAHV
ncbi:hypothetical protein [Armatimonas sp.]|uniref:hypothetical protein n=1 Tax=Armatimonas sp. TaxID=1872638 RepID=UPI0037502341